MYTHIKGVQILISLLKQYNIRHIVISPGTRNTALAHSVETDDFFVCYSIVDERSAGYFALGISEALGVPVCVSCTAATATCNYLPAMQEAYERNIQLIALTADQNPYEMFHMEDQCIDQVDMFHGYVKCAVDVPKVNNENDYWYFNRCVNEALLELDHHGKGPIQINYHMSYSLKEISTFDVEQLPVTRKVNRYTNDIDFDIWASELEGKRRILVVGGSDFDVTSRLRQSINLFARVFNATVIADTYSNIYGGELILNPKMLGDSITAGYIKQLAPDLIISFGNVYYSTVKYFMQNYSATVEHWQIAVDGMMNDGYHCLKNIFECRPEEFFEGVAEKCDFTNNMEYYNLWKKRVELFKYPDLKFTNFKVIKEFCERIPEDSILHTTVLDSIRMSNYVEMPAGVRCFANIGADGIDGALSTYLGQAKTENKLAFLLIGDLSLMYDMNALLQKIPNNVRVLVINNYAGAEFHKNFGLERIPTLNQYVAAGHNVKIEHCCINSQFKYLRASNGDELQRCLNEFLKDSDTPILFEVFTDAPTDAAVLKEYWNMNRIETQDSSGTAKRVVKTLANKLLGEKAKDKIKRIITVVKS